LLLLLVQLKIWLSDLLAKIRQSPKRCMLKIKNIQVNAGQTSIKIPVSNPNVKQKQAAAGNRSILPGKGSELN